jgi:hypothetical protein
MPMKWLAARGEPFCLAKILLVRRAGCASGPEEKGRARTENRSKSRTALSVDELYQQRVPCRCQQSVHGESFKNQLKL